MNSRKTKLLALSIVAITAIEGCAVAKIAPIAGSQPSTLPSVFYLEEINPDSPPRDGLWMTWAAARRFIHDERIEHRNNELAALELERQRDIANLRQANAEKALAASQSPAQSFWLTWGFPLGLLGGIAAGVGAALVAAKVTK